MGQLGRFLRKVQGGHAHWCPACGELHVIPSSWTFDGNIEAPTFSPSVKITGKKTIVDEKGEWTGEWVRDANGNAVDDCCHYNLTAGQLLFHADSLHQMRGTMPLPELPPHLRDDALS